MPSSIVDEKRWYRQLDELYRALHWYINGFQPSMKLVARRIEGRTIHRMYDTARTPWQRVLLSDAFSSSQHDELCVAVKALDPLRLFRAGWERLQQALFRCEARAFLADQPIPELQLFDLAGCAAELTLLEEHDADALPQEEEAQPTGIVDWRRTRKDPFAGQWKQILAWGQANPTQSCGDILRELQSLFPGRYEDSHLRTLQRGMRKVRTHVLQVFQVGGSLEASQGNELSFADLDPAKPGRESLDAPSFGVGKKIPVPDGPSPGSSDQHPAGKDLSSQASRTKKSVLPSSMPAPDQVVRHSYITPSRSVHRPSSRKKSQRLTIERAIQQYLQAHRKVGHRPKTLEWHRMVLSHVQHYVLTECHLLFVHQITETTLRDWLERLSQMTTRRRSSRSASTIETYARSARAFCGWLVEQGVLSCFPLSERVFPRIRIPFPHVVSSALFEQIMRAVFPQQAQTQGTKRLLDRDRALLWVLFETGITVTEVRALRVADLDLKTSLLHVRGKEAKNAI